MPERTPRIYIRFIEPFTESNLHVRVCALHNGRTSARPSGNLAHVPASPSIPCSFVGIGPGSSTAFAKKTETQEDNTAFRAAHGKRNFCAPPGPLQVNVILYEGGVDRLYINSLISGATTNQTTPDFRTPNALRDDRLGGKVDAPFLGYGAKKGGGDENESLRKATSS